MVTVFKYHDYREFLNDFYQEKKKLKGFISYRMMGKHFKVDASYLVKVLKKGVNLKDDTIPSITTFCKLTPKEADYFEALFFFTKAKNEKDIAHYYEKMQAIRGVNALTVKTGQYEFYSKWHYSALWALLKIDSVKGKKQLGKMLVPPIKENQTKDALTLLETLDLIESDADGVYSTKDKHLQTGLPVNPSAIKAFHSQMISLADTSLYHTPRAERDISGMTLALDEDCLEDIKEIIQATRNKIRARVDEVINPDRVLQANFQLFPIARVRGSNDR